MKFKLFLFAVSIALLWHAYKPVPSRISPAARKRGILFPSESGAYDFLSPKPIPKSLLWTAVRLEIQYFNAEGMVPAKWPKVFRAYSINTEYMSCQGDQASWSTDACDGVTFTPPGDEIEMYVRDSEDSCITHTSLAHELGHVLLGGDHDHENVKFWGYTNGAILGRVYHDLELLYCPAFKGEDVFFKRHSFLGQKGKTK